MAAVQLRVAAGRDMTPARRPDRAAHRLRPPDHPARTGRPPGRKGHRVSGDITLALADIDLIYVSLRALISSVSTLEEQGPATDDLAVRADRQPHGGLPDIAGQGVEALGQTCTWRLVGDLVEWSLPGPTGPATRKRSGGRRRCSKALMEDRTVLPLRYGTVLEGVDALRSMIMGRQEQWLARSAAYTDALSWVSARAASPQRAGRPRAPQASRAQTTCAGEAPSASARTLWRARCIRRSLRSPAPATRIFAPPFPLCSPLPTWCRVRARPLQGRGAPTGDRPPRAGDRLHRSVAAVLVRRR